MEKKHALWQRMLSLFFAAALAVSMLPPGSITAWAAEGLTITTADSLSIELGAEHDAAKTLAFSLEQEGVDLTGYTYSWSAGVDSDIVSARIDTDGTLTLEPSAVAGKYGGTTVTVSVENVKDGEGNPVESPADVTVNVLVYYKPVMTVSLKDGADPSKVPYNTAPEFKVTADGVPDLTFGGKYEITYTWNTEDHSEPGPYTVTAFMSLMEGAEEVEGIVLADPADLEVTLVRLKPEVTVTTSNLDIEYGDDVAGKTITVSAEVPGKFKLGDPAHPVEVTVTDAPVEVPGTGFLDSGSVGEGKTFFYTFEPDDTDHYESIPAGSDPAPTASYSVKPRKLPVNLIVPGKNFDGTTTVDAQLADKDGVGESGEIHYGFDDRERMPVGEDAALRWKLDGIHFAYASIGEYKKNEDVTESPEVGVLVTGTPTITFYRADGDTLEAAPSGNYEIVFQTIPAEGEYIPEGSVCKAVIRINEYEGVDFYEVADAGKEFNNVLWFGSDQEKVTLTAKDDYTLNDGFSTDPTAYAASKAITVTNDGMTVHVRKEGKDPGVTTLTNVRKDVTTPTLEYKGADKFAIGFEHEITTYRFTLNDAESGVDADTIKYALSDNSTLQDTLALDDLVWRKITTDTGVVSVNGGNVTFQINVSESSYVWIQAADRVGNTFVSRRAVGTLVVENEPPRVTLTADNDAYAHSHSVAVAITDLPEGKFSGVQSYSWELKDSEGTVVLSAADLGDQVNPEDPADTQYQRVAPEDLETVADVGTMTATIAIRDDDLESGDLLDGEYTLSVIAADFSGNTNTSNPAECTLKFDSTGPEIHAVMDGAETDFYYREDNAGIVITVEDKHGAALDDYAVTLGSEDGSPLSVDLSAGSRDANPKVTLTKGGADPEGPDAPILKAVIEFSAEEVAQAFADGTVTLTVSARDKLNNDSAAAQFTAEGMTPGGTEAPLTASFVLDTTAPLVTLIDSSAGEKASHYYADTDLYYFNENNLTLIYTISEKNFAEEDFSLKIGGTDAAFTSAFNEAGAEATLTYAFPKDGVYSPISLLGKDKAGHLLTLASDEEQAAWKPQAKAIAEDGAVTLAVGWSVDTKAPTARITYNSSFAPGGVYEGDVEPGRVSYYYRDTVEPVVDFSDTDSENTENSLADTAWTVTKYSSGASADEIVDPTGTYRDTLSADGRYYYRITGEDRAGNVCVISEHNPSSVGGGEDYSQRDESENTRNTIVIDTTAPQVTFTISTTAANTALRAEYNNRFFFNAGFSGEFRVEETNFDETIVGAFYGYTASEDTLNTDVTASVEFTGSGQQYAYSSSQEGVYRLRLSGKDKAGNPLQLSGDAGVTLTSNPIQTADEDGLISYVVVVDTTAPTANVKIGDYYEANLTANGYAVVRNQPYRSESSAGFVFAGADNTPILVEYILYSSIANGNIVKAGGQYSLNESGSYRFQGEQILAINELSVEDLAGNLVEAPKLVDGRVSNLIYLDVTAPSEDTLQPIVTLVSRESGQGRSTAGVDLYDGAVTVEATVTEPGYAGDLEGGKSSGIYRVYYEVLHNNSEDWTSQLSGGVSTSGTVSSPGVIQFASGHGYTAVANEQLSGQQVIRFTFDAGSFNYNDISLRVWAEDNSGNLLPRENGSVYTFGIDTSNPSIRVSFDNNDVQNEKYFKADRVATVVVSERNFDPARTIISTQGASSGAWSYAAGASANGDDDTWTTTVSFSADGDYTFDVISSDLVNHSAGQADYSGSAAPQDFTIDKTAPTISILFDNNDVRNGKYYNAPRTARITIDEHNFRSTEASVSTTAFIQEGAVAAPTETAWISIGDDNVATVPFTEDGNYTMTVAFTDLAGNPADSYYVEEFTVDQTKPVLDIGGVRDHMAYGADKDIAPSITYYDINFDSDSPGVSITGSQNREERVLEGTPTVEAYGGSFVCNQIEKTKENDDIYTIKGTIRDLAGNETTETLVFSINCYGSNYLIENDETQAVLDNYYVNDTPELKVIEINVNNLDEETVRSTRTGETTMLNRTEDYSIETFIPGWVESHYTIFKENFEQDGDYVVILSSTDEAQNTNDNLHIYADNNVINELPIDFYVDREDPHCSFDGVEEGKQYYEDQQEIAIRFEDNTHISSLRLYLGDSETPVQTYADRESLDALDGRLVYSAGAQDDWQQVRAVLVDAAGNSAEFKSPRFLLTRNLWVQYKNNTPLVIGSAAGAAGIAGLVLILRLRRRRAR